MSIIFIFLLFQFLKIAESAIFIKFNRLMSIIKEETYSLDNQYVNQRIDNPYQTIIRIGDPSQYIPGFLKTDEHSFYLSNYNCPKYQSYHRTMSQDLKYITPKEYFDDGSINEYHFTDSLFFDQVFKPHLKIYDYPLIVDNNLVGPQCFHIGSQVLLNKEETGNNVIDVLFNKNYTESSLFEYNIINDDEMHLVFGLELSEEEKKKYKFINPITIYESEFYKNQKWGLTLDYININDYSKLFNNKFSAELDISVGCFLGNTEFHDYFKQYLKDNDIFVEPKICEQEYYIYFFNKDMKGFEKMKNFEIKFYNKEFNYNYTFNYEDLFLEKRNGYYLLIAFEKSFKANWKLGYPFFKKYKFIFDIDSKLIGFINPNGYPDDNKNIQESNFNVKKFLLIIGIIFIAIIILIIGIFIGKKLYEVRKARANELLDEYEYKENNDKIDIKKDEIEPEENIN